jgi:signal transduction histidine kinase
MNAKRALVSLFDREHQHVVAEASPDLRLRAAQGSEETNDLWLGVRQLSREEIPMCANAMRSFMEDKQEVFVVNDLTKDERFRDHSSVTGHPHNRFYVSVPIQSPDNYVIGSLAVLDDQPRDGVTEVQKQFLQDLSATVMDHLLAQRAMREEYREEKMVRALGLFVRGKSDLNEWFHTRDPPEKKFGQHMAQVNTKLEQLQVSGQNDGEEEFEEDQAQQEKPGSPNQAPAKAKTKHVSPIQKFREAKNKDENESAETDGQQEGQKTGEKRPCLSPTTSHLQDAIAPSNVRQVLNRASSLIYQALDVEGAMFVDASVYARRQTVGPTNAGNSHPETYDVQNQTDGDKQALAPANSKQKFPPSGNAGDSKSLVLGHFTSFSSKEDDNLKDSHYVSLPGDFVSHLIDRYPRGKIFHIEEDGSIALSYEGLADEMHYAPDGGRGARTSEAHKQDIQQETMDIKQLTQVLPGARCIAIYPVWDFQRGRWFTVSLTWANDPGRVLSEPKDLTYMAAFSNSVMAEVSRLDLEAADRAKGDFISSISHELRSPLHGLLGTVELLQEMVNGYAQRSLIETVYSCGRTLLDTLNHLLDYAKINTLTHSRRSQKGSHEGQSGSSQGQGPGSGVLQEEDLGVLVQEVVEGLLAGAEYQGRGTNSDGNTKNADDDSNGGLTTIVDIEWQDNWQYNIYAGAWRRVIMNIFGNAMKYTRRGFIRLLMKKDTLVVEGKTQPAVRLTVSDSGRGMSPDFLTHHLYSAFLQEDTTSPGLGVGLHLVNEIVKSLKGQIKVTSEVSRGTDVDVVLPVSRTDPSIPRSPLHASVKERLNGMTVSLFTKTALRKDIGDNLNISEGMLSSLERMVTDWFGLQVLTLDQLDHGNKVDFMIITEHEYRHLYRRGPNGLVPKNPEESQPSFPLIVLSARTSNWKRLGSRDDESIIFLTQP